MSDPVRVSRSVVGPAEAEAVTRVLERGFLGMGPEVQAFESELAGFIGSGRSVTCVNTGTAALHLAVQALGIGPGDEVLVPSLTYVASFQAVSATGATPVPCDIDPDCLCLDPKDAEGRITGRTRAVMPVHYASGFGRLDEVYALAAKHGLRVVEDAAHAFGCLRRGKRCGGEGDVVCFSFDGIKNITSGEGGAVVTADEDVAAHVRDARLLGVESDTEQRFKGGRSWEFDVSEQGWRYHMSDLMAAIGRTQLGRFPEFAEARVRLAERYAEALSGLAGLRTLGLEYGPIVPHIFPVLVANGRRDGLKAALDAGSVQTGMHYKPNHLLSRYGGGAVRLPRAEAVWEELLTLPLHPLLTEAQQDRIAGMVVAHLKGTAK